MQNRVFDSALGALLGTFVGDALGMPYEGWDPDAIPNRIEMVEARLGRGTYTDDTQMMIGLAESLVERGAVEPGHLARRFLDLFDPERGYGGGTQEVFRLWRSGTPSVDAAALVFGGEGSLGNGAAMRIAPVGVLYAHQPERLRIEAQASARLTHAHPIGEDAAIVQAAAVGAACRGDDVLSAAQKAARTFVMRQRLRTAENLLRRRLSAQEIAEVLGNSPAAHESVPTAIYAAVAEPNFERAVSFAVHCGGDTDTLGAMAGAIAGARHGAASIPRWWLEVLEDEERGRTHVTGLAQKLTEAVQSAMRRNER